MPLPNDPREITLRKTERVYVRLAVGIILGLCLLVAVCWGGRWGYVRWQERKLMHQAHVAFDKGDVRWSSLAAQRAYYLDDRSVDACRTLADLAEKQNSDQAIEWRRRALAIDPTSIPDRLALANTALHFSQPAIAGEALAAIPAAAQQNSTYQAAAARVALTKNDLGAAGAHLHAAVALAPNDLGRALELAEFQLRSTDETERAAGHAIASRLKTMPKVRLDALHILLTNALRRHDDAESISLAKELDAAPEAAPADRLLALGILRQYNDPDFAAALDRFQTESARSAESAARLIGWMNSHGLALLAMDWSKRLSPETLENLLVRLGLADSYVQLRDWTALRAMLQRGSWERVASLRLALSAKVDHETGQEDAVDKDWADAVVKAENDPQRLEMLQKLAFQWHWPEKGVAVLWLLADLPQTQQPSLQALYNYYAKARDTAGLYRALTRLVDVLPEDPLVKNNYAQIALLLHAQANKARALAQQLHEAQPKNPAFASTYAFGLFQNGEVPAALKVMQGLTPDQLRDPSVSAYYGVILAAAGQKEEAQKYLDASAKAQLLPEEEKLVSQARNLLARQERERGGT